MDNRKWHSWLFVVLIGIFTLASGCVRSLPVDYVADSTPLNKADALRNVSIGVAKFADKRPWVDPADDRSESYIAMQSPWKFGLTYQNKEYTPVKDLLQSILVQEFRAVNINAMPINSILCKQNTVDACKLGERDKTDYVLGGEVMIFEFVNDTGVWTITSRRTLALNLLLVKVDGGEVRLDSSLNETDREFEGMGIMHSTNIEKLMNKVVKKVVRQVIEQVAEKIARIYNDAPLEVVVNGRAFDLASN